MNRIYWFLLSLASGALGFALTRQDAITRDTQATAQEQEWQTLSNTLAESEQQQALWQAAVQQKKERLREIRHGLNSSPEIANLLLVGEASDHGPSGGQPKSDTAWAQLRQELALGWDASPDYVLVNKRILDQLDFPRLTSATRPDNTASEILALSPDDQSLIATAVKHVRDSSGSTSVQRNEPSGDIVAQYTALAMNPETEQSLSNRFAAEISMTLDSERVRILLPQAWREIRQHISPQRTETLTVRKVTEPEPDLVWESTQDGRQVASGRVRYAYYPSQWFMALFRGGWQTLAEREGFELPARFRSQP